MTITSPTGADLDAVREHAWRGFTSGPWRDAINVRDFIQLNYTPYDGDDSFLAGPTERTTGVWEKLSAMFPEEREKGVYDVDYETPATITAHKPGYIDQDNEVIVGLQTDAPLKRAIMPFGGWRMVVKELENKNGRQLPIPSGVRAKGPGAAAAFRYMVTVKRAEAA